MKKKKIVIFGDSAFAQIAFEYFQYDSVYEVVGFCVEKDFYTKNVLFGLPVIKEKDLIEIFPPESYEIFVAITYGQLNRLRTRLVNQLKLLGYKLASYVSSRSFVWPNVEIGEHCFIFEDNTVQPFVQIGSNVILWSGNHIGHHSKIADNCFISSHVVISGFCLIGKNSFLGVNSTISNNVVIGDDNWIGPASFVRKSTGNDLIYNSDSAEQSKVSAIKFFKIKNTL
jgi:sugar O-acyltransferase (sialic acid O-acetyltransferase NeuD family)